MKTFSVIIGLFIGVNLSFGQGTVIFANYASTRIFTNSYPGGPATGLTTTNANSYYYALFVAPTNVSNVSGNVFSDGNWTFTGNYATNSQHAVGRLAGGYNSDETSTISGYAPGSFANFVVIGWSANIGATVADFVNWYNNPTIDGWFGQSSVAVNLLLGGGLYAPMSVFYGSGTTTLGEIDGFTVNYISANVTPTPEPSAMALFALSGGWLMLRARQRK